MQVNQEATGSRAVQAVWADQQHHQAVDQSHEGGAKALNDKDQRLETNCPLAGWCRPLSEI